MSNEGDKQAGSLTPNSEGRLLHSQRPITAFVGQCQSFGTYLSFYEHVINHLFVEVENGREPVDIVAPPLLFMMRHAMELGYKYTLWGLHRLNKKPYDVKGYKTHSLSHLHAALVAQYKKAIVNYDLPEEEVDEFNRYYKKN